ncbi:MAG: hypothetical protein HWD60_17980 [Defluviicoccus sp.]|nr:MAG: hypothetical protein HWD60_17980 [Defluviicoccus sp.]
MSTLRVDARDVFDANAKTARNFRARIVGHFRRVGPNVWDDYIFEPIDGGQTVDVLAGVPVQVETQGVEADDACFRMHRHGEVDRLVWESDQSGDDLPHDRRTHFLAECVRAFSEAHGIGGAAVIAGKLRSSAAKPSLE